MLEELYKELQKFSREEVLHFCKLGQQRKTTSENESSRPYKYNIDSDGCGPLENWEKNFRLMWQENKNEAYDPRREHQQTRGGYSS
jgi:hypothetical protein